MSSETILKPTRSKKAVVLLSGGIDSVTCLAIAKSLDYQCYAMAIDYDQKNIIELKAAETIAENYACLGFRKVKLSIGEISGAALTDVSTEVPIHSDNSAENGINSTYFPARNTIFLSLALAWAESLKAETIFLGINLDDFQGFPDARPDYLSAFNQLAQLATRVGREETNTISIEAPLLKLNKSQIIKKGLELQVDYSTTITCYSAGPDAVACGKCDSCVIRQNAFTELGLDDPAKSKKLLAKFEK